MKKIVALLLACSLLLALALSFASCDYQDTVDSARSELMEAAKDLLDPFLNRSESQVEEEPTDQSDVNM